MSTATEARPYLHDGVRRMRMAIERVANIHEATYQHDEAGNRIPDCSQGDLSAADIVGCLCEIEGLIGDAVKAGREMQARLECDLLFDMGEIFEEEPGYLLATATLFGVFHHVEFIRVIEKDSQQQPWHPECGAGDEDNNNEERFDALNIYDGAYHETVKVPGFEGDYVCVITPYGR